MKSRKVIQLLQDLTEKEWGLLQELAAISWFSPNPDVARLLKLLAPQYPMFDDAQLLDRKRLFGLLYPDVPYNDQDFRVIVSRLNKLVEELVVQRELRNEPHRYKQLLLQGVEKRGIPEVLEKQLTRMSRSLEKAPTHDLPWHEHQIAVKATQYWYHALRKSRDVENELQPLIDAIDLHFFYHRLQYSCEMLNLENILDVEFDKSFLEVVTTWLDAHPVTGSPAISIYREILRTLQDSDDEAHFTRLRQLLHDNLDTIPAVELKGMFAFAQNYCIKQTNLGNDQYMRELFDLYHLQIDRSIINAGGVITQFDYKNIVTVGLRLNELDWVSQFIETEREHVEERFRHNAYSYNLARLYFSKNEFHEALRALLRVAFTDVFYGLDSRSLLLKTYYELEEYESFLSLVSSFGLFLRRNHQISDYQRTVYRNLIRFSRKLFRIKMGGKQNPQAVRNEMQQVKRIADLTWLNAKVDELLDGSAR